MRLMSKVPQSKRKTMLKTRTKGDAIGQSRMLSSSGENGIEVRSTEGVCNWVNNTMTGNPTAAVRIRTATDQSAQGMNSIFSDVPKKVKDLLFSGSSLRPIF